IVKGRVLPQCIAVLWPFLRHTPVVPSLVLRRYLAGSWSHFGHTSLVPSLVQLHMISMPSPYHLHMYMELQGLMSSQGAALVPPIPGEKLAFILFLFAYVKVFLYICDRWAFPL